MKTVKYICGIALAAATIALGGCNNDVEMPVAAESTLGLDVVAGSRAPIYDDLLPDPSKFSIACVNLTGGIEKTEIREVEYSGATTSIIGSPVTLRGDSVYRVFAMYPAIEKTEEILSGNITLSARSQTDYMKAISGDLTYKNSHAYLKFEHMLSLLRLNINKDNFITDDYRLKALALDNIGMEGVYNFQEQRFIEVYNCTYSTDGTEEFRQPIVADKYLTVDILMIPSSGDLSGLILYFDSGKEIGLKFEHGDYAPGNIYTLNITVSADQLTITQKDVQPWIAPEPVDVKTPVAAPGKPVDLGLSKLWADRNLGAYDTSEYGDYYPYTQEVSAMWGAEWQAPTQDDFKELIDKCTWKWVNNGSIKGYQVTGNGNTIFLPAAGWIYEPAMSYNNLNQSGLYSSADAGYALEFSLSGKNVLAGVDGAFLRSIRPVKVKK